MELWTGFYVGGNLGYSWGRAASEFFSSSTAPSICLLGGCGPTEVPVTFSDTAKPNGVIGGGQIGYNWQAPSNWVLGLEADIQGSGEKGSFSPTEPFSFVTSQVCAVGVCSGHSLTVFANVAGTASGCTGRHWCSAAIMGSMRAGMAR